MCEVGAYQCVRWVLINVEVGAYQWGGMCLSMGEVGAYQWGGGCLSMGRWGWVLINGEVGMGAINAYYSGCYDSLLLEYAIIQGAMII